MVFKKAQTWCDHFYSLWLRNWSREKTLLTILDLTWALISLMIWCYTLYYWWLHWGNINRGRTLGIPIIICVYQTNKMETVHSLENIKLSCYSREYRYKHYKHDIQHFTSTLVVTLYLRPLHSTDRACVEPHLIVQWKNTPWHKHRAHVDFMWRHCQSAGEIPAV